MSVAEAGASGKSDRLDPSSRRLGLLAAFLLLATAPALADNVRGGWSALGDWPLVPIHAVLVPDGRVLTYGTKRDGTQTGRFDYDVWDPRAGLAGGHLTLPNSTTTDLFCSAQIVLPQSGDVLLAGGDNWTGTQTTNTGNDDTNLFKRQSSSLAPAKPMQRERWYATLTTLPNGETYIQGGKGGIDEPEIRSLGGDFRPLADADTSKLYYWYPRNFVAPDGRIFGIANRSLYFVDVGGRGTVSGMGSLPTGPTGITSSEVMYAPGKILRCGGGATGSSGGPPGSTTALVIDIARPVPKVTPTAAMPVGAHWHTATVGADGRVFVTGGAEGNNVLTGVHANVRIWNPATGTWSLGAATVSGKARLYHSTALLLPDASILVGGGGAPGPQTNLNAEIYYPPYLYDGGGLASRPTLTQAPDSLDVGVSFPLQVGDAAGVRRVTLVKTGSVTHSFDMDQRFLELDFATSGDGLQVQAPATAAAAPPGTYLLFVIDDRGVPSIGRIVTMRVAARSTVAVDHTPTVGEGIDGAGFTLTCPSGSALVGIFAGSSTIARIGPRCVRVDRAGRWQGSVSNGASAPGGGTATVRRTCPQDMVVSGFRARSSTDLKQLEIACRPLDASGKTTGTARFLPAVGSATGAVHGPFACSTGNPAYALYGRAGSNLVRSIGVLCRATG